MADFIKKQKHETDLHKQLKKDASGHPLKKEAETEATHSNLRKNAELHKNDDRSEEDAKTGLL